jgi:hypothetical protein
MSPVIARYCHSLAPRIAPRQLLVTVSPAPGDTILADPMHNRWSRPARDPPFWAASVPSVSARCSVQNWPIGRTPVDAPAGRTVRVCSVRLVSFTHRPVAAICYEVEPVDGPARITVQSELTANEQLPPAGADPRVAAALEDPLRGEYHDATGTAVALVHKTRRSGLRVGAAMDHLVDCPAPVRAESRSFADGGLVTAATVLAPGQKLRVIKFGG